MDAGRSDLDTTGRSVCPARRLGVFRSPDFLTPCKASAMTLHIPFNKPCVVGSELIYVGQAVAGGPIGPDVVVRRAKTESGQGKHSGEKGSAHASMNSYEFSLRQHIMRGRGKIMPGGAGPINSPPARLGSTGGGLLAV